MGQTRFRQIEASGVSAFVLAEVHLNRPLSRGIQRNVVHNQVIGWHMYTDESSSVYDALEIDRSGSDRILWRAYKVKARGCTSPPLK